MTHRSLLAALTLLAAAAPAARAQMVVPDDVARPWTSACVAAIPDSALARVAAYATVELHDTTQRAAMTPLENLLPVVANHVGALLGAGRDTVPRGDPRVTWRDVDGGPPVEVVWHRDGRIDWALWRDTVPNPDTSTLAASRLLLRALDSTRADGEFPLLWPEGLAGDSVRFRLRLVRVVVDEKGKAVPLLARVLVPVFTLGAPRQSGVRPLKISRPSYPAAPQQGHATGVVIIDFVVDSTGRAVMSTVHDEWPRDRPRLQGELATYYESFLEAARRSIERSRYAPARLNGCPVGQLVQQPFTFSFGR